MAADHRHARRRPIGQRRRLTRRAHWKVAKGIEVGIDVGTDWAKWRLSWVPPWFVQRWDRSGRGQLARWLGGNCRRTRVPCLFPDLAAKRGRLPLLRNR